MGTSAASTSRLHPTHRLTKGHCLKMSRPCSDVLCSMGGDGRGPGTDLPNEQQDMPAFAARPVSVRASAGRSERV